MKTRIKVLLNKKPIPSTIVLAVILNLAVEMLSRRSVVEGLIHLVTNPFVFFNNALIIFLTLVIALLFKRRLFATVAVSCVWLGLGIANCLLLGMRITPLGAKDFKVLLSAFDIVGMYLDTWQVILVFAALAVVFITIGRFWFKAPKSQRNLLKSLIVLAVSFVIVFGCLSFSIRNNTLATTFTNIATAYNDNGFAYCFSCSVFYKGIDRPENYSQAAVAEILNEIDDKSVAKSSIVGAVGVASTDGSSSQPETVPDTVEAVEATDSTPNVIFLQMESFFDMDYLKNLQYSTDPTPNFNALKADYQSGFLTVPVVGAGTANTEFEVLTGMCSNYFGPGEYPFNTVLQNTTCESLAYILKSQGYATHAIHNHRAAFYDRNVVYANLGFDTFTSIEYMLNVERTPQGWAKDNVLTEEIFKSFDSTEGGDFVFTVSVQGHGQYPEEPLNSLEGMEYATGIDITGIEDEATRNAFEYYAYQAKEMDQFIGDLTTALENYDEPTVLVIYGDHLPNLAINADDLSNGNIFQTEYVIWSNYSFGSDNVDENLTSYQLSSKILDELSLKGGIMTALHENNATDSDYMDQMKMLSYDMLYGQNYCYNGVAFQPTQIKLGIDEITVDGIEYQVASKAEEYGAADKIYLYIHGENFTKYSDVFINGEKISTKFIDNNTLRVKATQLNVGDIITVCQLDKDRYVLSETKPYRVQEITDLATLEERLAERIEASEERQQRREQQSNVVTETQQAIEQGVEDLATKQE